MSSLHVHHRDSLVRMQALLELQRQADSTRISSTRELTRRPSGSQIPPLPPGGAPESSAALAAWDHQRSQSQSFTGGHLSLDLPMRWLAGFSIHAHRPLLMCPAAGCFCTSWLYAKESACRNALCCSMHPSARIQHDSPCTDTPGPLLLQACSSQCPPCSPKAISCGDLTTPW